MGKGHAIDMKDVALNEDGKQFVKNAQGAANQPYIFGNQKQREGKCSQEIMQAITVIEKKYDCRFLPALQIAGNGQIIPMYMSTANPPKQPGKGNGGGN